MSTTRANSSSSSQRQRSPGADLETVFSSMRDTLTEYRDAMLASEEEKNQLVETVRSLRDQLAASGGGGGSRRESGARDRSGSGSGGNNNNQLSAEGASSSSAAATPSSPKDVARQLQASSAPPTRSLPRVGRQPSPHAGGAASNAKQHDGNTSNAAVAAGGGGGGSRQNSPKPNMPWHSPNGDDQQQQGGTTTSHEGSNASTRASPERMQGELRIANSKMDHMARELQRVHHDYQSEIKRLHRMIARLEGQVLEVTQYSYASADSANSSVANTPAIRPPPAVR